MSYVGPWKVDPDSLRAAIEEWVAKHEPTEFERDQVDDWVRRAEEGPWFVGTEDKDRKGLYYGVPADTNVVIEYYANLPVLEIWLSQITPRA